MKGIDNVGALAKRFFFGPLRPLAKRAFNIGCDDIDLVGRGVYHIQSGEESITAKVEVGNTPVCIRNEVECPYSLRNVLFTSVHPSCSYVKNAVCGKEIS